MNKKILILFFLFSCSVSAQNSKIDSLLNVLKTLSEAKSSSGRDTSRINTLNALSEQCWRIGDYEKAMQYANDALVLCQLLEESKNSKNLKLSIRKGEALAYWNMGIVYDEKGDYNKSLELLFKSLKLFEELAANTGFATEAKKGLAGTNNSIGIIHYNKGDYEKALEHYLKALSIREEINDKKGMAGSCNNIGILYKEKADFDKALEFYYRALKIYEEIGDRSRAIANTLNNIGLVIYERAVKKYGKRNENFSSTGEIDGEHEKALEYYFKANKIQQEIGDKNGMAMSYNNIGIIYDEKGDVEKALEIYYQALSILKELGEKNRMAATYINIGTLYTLQKQFREAKEALNQALLISKEIGTKEWTKLAYEGLSHWALVQEKWKDAYEYHQLYSQMKDSIFNEESSKQIAEMQTKYETEKKELQIENLNKDNAIKETEIKKQNFQKLAFAGGFGLMLILAFVIFRGYKQKQKANEIITAQKTEVEKQKEMVDEKNRALEVAYKHIEEKNTEILDSIRYAKRIQEAILPPQKLVKQYLENSFILYKPKDIVAGDFYWMHCSTDLKSVPQQTILFASVDCTGHGVPGAFMSILGYNGLNRCVKEFGLTQPAAILDKLCELVDEAFSKSENDIKDGMDIALCSLEMPNPERVLNPFGVIQYAGAGNSLYHIRNGNLNEYSPDKQPIGKFAYRKPFTNHEIQLEKGDSIYIFTDGYADQFGGPKGKKFKYSQFEKLLLSLQEKSMTEQREILNTTIDEWKGDLEQIDDICIIGVRV